MSLVGAAGAMAVVAGVAGAAIGVVAGVMGAAIGVAGVTVRVGVAGAAK